MLLPSEAFKIRRFGWISPIDVASQQVRCPRSQSADTLIASLSQSVDETSAPPRRKAVKHFDELCSSRWPRSSHAKMMLAGSVNGRLRDQPAIRNSLVPPSETADIGRWVGDGGKRPGADLQGGPSASEAGLESGHSRFPRLCPNLPRIGVSVGSLERTYPQLPEDPIRCIRSPELDSARPSQTKWNSRDDLWPHGPDSQSSCMRT